MDISLEEFINYNQSGLDQIDPSFRESIFTQYQGSPQLENTESRSNSFSQRLQEKLNFMFYRHFYLIKSYCYHVTKTLILYMFENYNRKEIIDVIY